MRIKKEKIIIIIEQITVTSSLSYTLEILLKFLILSKIHLYSVAVTSRNQGTLHRKNWTDTIWKLRFQVRKKEPKHQRTRGESSPQSQEKYRIRVILEIP